MNGNILCNATSARLTDDTHMYALTHTRKNIHISTNRAIVFIAKNRAVPYKINKIEQDCHPRQNTQMTIGQ